MTPASFVGSRPDFENLDLDCQSRFGDGPSIGDLVFSVEIPPRSRISTLRTEGDNLQTRFVSVFGNCDDAGPSLCVVPTNDAATPRTVFIVADQINSFGFRTSDEFTILVDTEPLAREDSCLSASRVLEGTTSFTVQTSQEINTYQHLCGEVFSGQDAVRRLTVPAQTRVEAVVSSQAFEARVALSTSCDDVEGTCVAADQTAGSSNAVVSWDNTTDAPVDVILVFEPVSSSFVTVNLRVGLTPL